jgi:hypothetical protein
MSYELKQTTLLELEIEVLREKILTLNQEIRILKAELRMFGIVKELDDKIHNAIMGKSNGNGLVDKIELKK